MYKNTDKSTYMEENAKCKLVIDYPGGIVQRLKEFDITLDGEKIGFNKKGGKLEMMIDKGGHIIELFQPLYADQKFVFDISDQIELNIGLQFELRKSWLTIIALGFWICGAFILGFDHWKGLIPSTMVIIPSLYINNAKFTLTISNQDFDQFCI